MQISEGINPSTAVVDFKGDELTKLKAIIMHARQLYQQLDHLYEQAWHLYFESTSDSKRTATTNEEPRT